MTTRLATSWKWLLACGAVFVPASVLAVSIPNSFSPGTPIKSDEVNTNFTTLETAVTDLENKKADAPAKGEVMPSARGKLAYLWSGTDCPTSTTADCVPPAAYNFTSETTSPTITRQSTGDYLVNLPDVTIGNGSVQVTAYGNSANYCKVRFFNSSNVRVLCFTPAGAATDSAFTLLAVN